MTRTTFIEGDIIAKQGSAVKVPVDADDYESGMVAIASANDRFKPGTRADAEGASVRGIFYIGGEGKATKANGDEITMLTGFTEVYGSKLKSPTGQPLAPTQKTKNNLLYHAEIIVR